VSRGGQAGVGGPRAGGSADSRNPKTGTSRGGQRSVRSPRRFAVQRSSDHFVMQKQMTAPSHVMRLEIFGEVSFDPCLTISRSAGNKLTTAPVIEIAVMPNRRDGVMKRPGLPVSPSEVAERGVSVEGGREMKLTACNPCDAAKKFPPLRR